MAKTTRDSGSSNNLTPAQTPRTWTGGQLAQRHTGVFMSGGNVLPAAQPIGIPAVGDSITSESVPGSGSGSG